MYVICLNWRWREKAKKGEDKEQKEMGVYTVTHGLLTKARKGTTVNNFEGRQKQQALGEQIQVLQGQVAIPTLLPEPG